MLNMFLVLTLCTGTYYWKWKPNYFEIRVGREDLDPVSWRGASQIYDRNATLFQRKFESIVRWVSQTTYDRSAAAFQS